MFWKYSLSLRNSTTGIWTGLAGPCTEFGTPCEECFPNSTCYGYGAAEEEEELPEEPSSFPTTSVNLELQPSSAPSESPSASPTEFPTSQPPPTSKPTSAVLVNQRGNSGAKIVQTSYGLLASMLLLTWL
mmetsp:Transcript_28902/g.44147  ORF Transcript_28902/g.44147 Transcript_28902/m.44147 type:complete len:130 (-) Transcript_28902:309-698(-)